VYYANEELYYYYICIITLFRVKHVKYNYKIKQYT
jgi:hypothetical protein